MVSSDKFPKVDEFVLAKVTKINPNSIFTSVESYGNKSALIHISEISPGRIRNIRDFVSEGKKIVCKVLKVNEERGHIDLSLRRVTEIQRRNFVSNLKQEQKADKLLSNYLEQKKLPLTLKKSIVTEIKLIYDNIYDFYSDLVEDEIEFSKVIEKTENVSDFEDFIKDKIKPAEVEIKLKLDITIYEPKGIDIVKKMIKKISGDFTTIKYLGSGAYSLLVKSKEFKDAEKLVDQKTKILEKEIEKYDGIFTIERKS